MVVIGARRGPGAASGRVPSPLLTCRTSGPIGSRQRRTVRMYCVYDLRCRALILCLNPFVGVLHALEQSRKYKNRLNGDYAGSDRSSGRLVVNRADPRRIKRRSIGTRRDAS